MNQKRYPILRVMGRMMLILLMSGPRYLLDWTVRSKIVVYMRYKMIRMLIVRKVRLKCLPNFLPISWMLNKTQSFLNNNFNIPSKTPTKIPQNNQNTKNTTKKS